MVRCQAGGDAERRGLGVRGVGSSFCIVFSASCLYFKDVNPRPADALSGNKYEVEKKMTWIT